MSENKDNPNVEWKKSGFDESEKMSRSVDGIQAEHYQASKKRPTSPQNAQAVLPLNLNKIRKKIKDVLDDEEEDENDYQLLHPSTLMDASLLNALNEEEKKQLSLKSELENVRLQQNAGKMESMLFLDKVVNESGLKALDQSKMQESIDNPTVTSRELLKETIKDDLAKNAGLKWQNLSDKEVVTFLRGVKKVNKVGGQEAMVGMTVKDVLEAGEIEIKHISDEKRIAKIILRKTGRDKKKRQKETQRLNKLPKNRSQTALDKDLERG